MERNYLRRLPRDPVTDSAATWIIVQAPREVPRGGSLRSAQWSAGQGETGVSANGKGQDGFGLVFLIFLIAAAGLAMAGLGKWSRTAQRQKREELDFIGRQFVLAIESYRSQSPDGSPPLPQRLEDLLTDTAAGRPGVTCAASSPIPIVAGQVGLDGYQNGNCRRI